MDDDAERDAFKRVLIDVEHVAPVDGFSPAVYAGSSGGTVDIAVPRDLAHALGLAQGMRVELQTRATPAGLFAHPDRARVIEP